VSSEPLDPARPGALERAVRGSYLAALFLLPWMWFPPFPWLHEHAQWSDALIALAAALWVLQCWREGHRPRLGLAHAGMAVYLGAAALSVALVTPGQVAPALKLVGMAELAVLAVLTADLAPRPGMMPAIGRAVLWTSLTLAAGVAVGYILFYAGIHTQLLAQWGGDLVPSPGFRRAKGGALHPSLLASFGIFAAAVLAHPGAELPPRWRRLAVTLVGVIAMLTLSRGLLGLGLGAAIRWARGPAQRVLVAGLATVLAALVLVLAVVPLVLDPARPWAARIEGPPTIRHQTIAGAWAAALEHPLLGIGLGRQPARAVHPRWPGVLNPWDAHLTPLNIASTMGWPAVAGFLLIPFGLWRERSRPTDVATWSGLAGLGLDGLGHDVEDFRHLWVLFGLAGAPLTAGRPTADHEAHSTPHGRRR
jgi:hypothetical protein